jgi:hypothetical protein
MFVACFRNYLTALLMISLIGGIAACKVYSNQSEVLTEVTDRTKLVATAMESCYSSEALLGELRYCVDAQSASKAMVKDLLEKLEGASKQWVFPLAEIEPKLEDMKYINSCDDPHVTAFILDADGSGFAGCGVIQLDEKQLNRTSNKRKFNGDLLHLVGMALFSMPQTYEDYGVCLKDQKPSIMCKAGKTELFDASGTAQLFEADKNLIRSSYRKWSQNGQVLPKRTLN